MFRSKLLTSYLPFPYLSHHFHDWNMSLYSYPPNAKKPSSGGEEISLGDLTIPPSLTENLKHWSENPKNYPIQPSDELEENLDKIMTKNSSLINDRMESKIIPFRYVENK